jgi:drug/metabolite transporter (DMT)-like permease
MTSPFTTYEEFAEVNGAMYTFANNPTMIGILLAIALAITIYFFYASFHLRETAGKTPTVLSIVLALVTTAGSLLHSQPAKQSPSATHRHRATETVSVKKWQPLALLGMVGTSSTLLRTRKGRSVRSSRSKTRR